MNDLISSPLFGMLTSLIAYSIGVYINKRTKLAIFNPLLIAIAVLILFLSVFHIKYEEYDNGGKIISFFLYPATVALALPLYKKFSLFKQNAGPILAGILSSVVFALVCVAVMSRLFGFSDLLIKSLMPKSITTPIGMAVSAQLGGIPSITVIAIIITGITGSIVGPVLCRLLRLNDSIAAGVAMGAASHAVGTAKAIELGETEGAMGGLTLAVCGVITVFLAPLFWELYLLIFK